MLNNPFSNLLRSIASLLPLLPRPNTNTSGLSIRKHIPMKSTQYGLVEGLRQSRLAHTFITPDVPHPGGPVLVKEFLELPNNGANSQPLNELA